MAWINRRWPAWKKTVLMERSTKAPKSASKRERETAVDGTKIGIGVVSNLNTRLDGYCYGWLLVLLPSRESTGCSVVNGDGVEERDETRDNRRRRRQEERDGGIDGMAVGCIARASETWHDDG